VNDLEIRSLASRSRVGPRARLRRDGLTKREHDAARDIGRRAVAGRSALQAKLSPIRGGRDFVAVLTARIGPQNTDDPIVVGAGNDRHTHAARQRNTAEVGVRGETRVRQGVAFVEDRQRERPAVRQVDVDLGALCADALEQCATGKPDSQGGQAGEADEPLTRKEPDVTWSFGRSMKNSVKPRQRPSPSNSMRKTLS
jgi:hypothetical protein